jgi:hypothetical protein
MNGELPRWDIVPELASQEILPIPTDANDNWCSLANYLYSGQNYETNVFGGHYWLSKLTIDGRAIPSEYQPKRIIHSDGTPAAHSFFGTFISVGMRPDFGLVQYRGPIKKIPFVRLAFVKDIDAGKELSRQPDQHVLVPLLQMRELVLERQER